LLAPVGRSIFDQRYWEHEPVLLRSSDSDRLAGILDLDDMDRLLHTSGLRGPTYKVIKNLQEVPPAEYSKTRLGWGSGSVSNFIDGNRVMAHMREGASLLFGSLHRLWGPVAQACRLVEQTWGHPVAANGYLTPPNSQGFRPHWDYQSLFILQTAGTKTWKIYNPVLPLPLKHQVCPPEGVLNPGAPFMEKTLQPGDVLYVPRGWVHEAASGTQTALHVSLSIMPATWMDVMQQVLNRMADDPRFRTAVHIPVDRPADMREVDEVRFQALLKALVEEADLDDAVEDIARRFVNTRLPSLQGTLNELDQRSSVGPDTLLKRRPGVIYRIETHGEQVHLMFQGQTMKLPWELVNAVRFVSEAACFSPDQLPADLPQENKVALSRSLLEQGFLTFA
jgi:hypothetical protein